MKIKKCYVLKWYDQGTGENIIELVFKTLKDLEKYVKERIADFLLDTFEYKNEINNKKFKKDLKEEFNTNTLGYCWEEIELR